MFGPSCNLSSISVVIKAQPGHFSEFIHDALSYSKAIDVKVTLQTPAGDLEISPYDDIDYVIKQYSLMKCSLEKASKGETDEALRGAQ